MQVIGVSYVGFRSEVDWHKIDSLVRVDDSNKLNVKCTDPLHVFQSDVEFIFTRDDDVVQFIHALSPFQTDPSHVCVCVFKFKFDHAIVSQLKNWVAEFVFGIPFFQQEAFARKILFYEPCQRVYERFVLAVHNGASVRIPIK